MPTVKLRSIDANSLNVLAVLGEIQISLLLCSTKIKSIMKLLQLVLAVTAGCVFALSCADPSSSTETPIQDSDGTATAKSSESYSVLSAPVTTAVANQMKTDYANNRVLDGKYLKDKYYVGVDNVTVTRDAQGRIIDAVINEDRALNSWWIAKKDLEDIRNITNYSGIRVFPGIDRTSVIVVDTNQTEFLLNYGYHTLVFNGTQGSGNDQPNHGQSYQYVTVCPDRCFKNNSGRYP
jgi:hypothetical protein